MTLAIDFDGVVHDSKNPIAGRRMGAPLAGAKEALTELNFDHKIIIFSVWAKGKGAITITDWMNYYDIPFTEITNIKPQADVYLDDKAIRFTSWSDKALRGFLELP